MHGNNAIRLFNVPNINIEDAACCNLINWQQNITEPPIIQQVSDKDVLSFISHGGEGELPLPRLPCHTQAVKRSVKNVTEASATLCSKTAREGYIKAKIASRSVVP
jgi:hypothetical protein